MLIEWTHGASIDYAAPTASFIVHVPPHYPSFSSHVRSALTQMGGRECMMRVP